MSFASPISPFGPDGQDLWSEGCSGLTQQLCGVSRFVREFTFKLRFGRLSRSPLHLIKLIIKDDGAECDWISRDQDPWDHGLPRDIGQKHASLQALKDAIDVRALLFASLPDLSRAKFQVYRQSRERSRELIIVGNVRREESAHRAVHSIAMRAKLVGLRFDMDDGLLRRLPWERQASFCD